MRSKRTKGSTGPCTQNAPVQKQDRTQQDRTQQDRTQQDRTPGVVPRNGLTWEEQARKNRGAGSGKRRLQLEIRPGSGGDDSLDFGNDLAKILTKHIRNNGGVVHDDYNAETRCTILQITGFEKTKLERFVGKHRVQREPKNGKGKRHTSWVDVDVTDTYENSEQLLQEEDLLEEVHRGNGKGGQHQNTSDTAVRLRHLPTGEQVDIAHGRSQWANRQKARALMEQKLQKRLANSRVENLNRQRTRKDRGGDWTWNMQRDEVVEHATGTKHRLKEVKKGQFE